MALGTIILSGRDWLWPVAGSFAGAAALIVWSYLRSPAPAGMRLGCALLKLAGVVALLLCLLEPMGMDQRARPGANYFAIVADNSQGMRIKDPGENASRGEQLRKFLLNEKADWRERLEETFQTRHYLFDSRFQSIKEFDELQFDGRASSIGGALRSLTERYRGQPLAGILLFTDGNATDLPTGMLNTEGMPPVYPVVMGGDATIPDVSIQKITVTRTAFEDTPVTVQVDAGASGYSGKPLVAQLLDPSPATTNSAAGPAAPRVISQQTQRVTSESDTLTFRFQFRPEKPGISFYQARVSAQDETDQFDTPETSREATLVNNLRTVVVDHGGQQYRVLYVSGRPNWEFKFLNRALEDEQDRIQMVALIRVAKREPKFDYRGRAGESSNPLYRGFGNQSREEIERYDQPVLVRLNTRDQTELQGGFPKTEEQLYAYHAVILDDLEAEFFTHDQMTLLQKFVSERGGGFLMLGGQESFVQGKYAHTPVADLLPVYVDRAPEGKPMIEARLDLTREGWLQPWARLRSNETDEKTRLSSMPPFLTLNRVRDVKPGASVIATATDQTGATFPALAVQRYGLGRSAAMMIGDVWHWGLHDEVSRKDMDKSWRQLMRWLLTDVPQPVSVEAEPKPEDPNQTVLLSVRARDPKYQPLDNASVSLRVQAFPTETTGAATNETATNAVRLMAESSATEAGLYQAGYVPRLTGGYKASAIVTNAAGAEVGRAETGWTADPAADEFRSLKPNRALMTAIARQTGGEVVPLANLDAFVRSLPDRKAPVSDPLTYPLWHRPWVLLFALACFAAEWGWRRMKGLA